jgi:hypothetical protein
VALAHAVKYLLLQTGRGRPTTTQEESGMNQSVQAQQFQESRIEDEPILGPVLAMPDGRVQPLTWLERVMVALRLTNARSLEARYFKPVHR